MTRSMPYLALDSAGKRTILCDHPIKMFDNTHKEHKETKMGRILTAKETMNYVIGQDSNINDETASQIKQFLSSKLSHEDHAKVCSMMDVGGETQDDDLPENAVEKPPGKGSVSAAADARLRDDFSRRYPGLSAIKINNSGIQPKRVARASGADAASFNARFPGLAHIKSA